MGLQSKSGPHHHGYDGRLLRHIVTGATALLLAACSAGAQEAVPPAMIARGDSIFHGKLAGGTCITCHQANAKGIPGLAPDLTDKTWLHSDGSLAAIVATIEKGVPKPKQAAAPMLPKGGTNLSPDQIQAVAAYVHSLSAKR
ncbi:MAG: c-type cytochrome [Gemmatimonadaceae bacterium]